MIEKIFNDFVLDEINNGDFIMCQREEQFIYYWLKVPAFIKRSPI